jgi:hypothetical protein
VPGTRRVYASAINLFPSRAELDRTVYLPHGKVPLHPVELLSEVSRREDHAYRGCGGCRVPRVMSETGRVVSAAERGAVGPARPAGM